MAFACERCSAVTCTRTAAHSNWAWIFSPSASRSVQQTHWHDWQGLNHTLPCFRDRTHPHTDLLARANNHSEDQYGINA